MWFQDKQGTELFEIIVHRWERGDVVNEALYNRLRDAGDSVLWTYGTYRYHGEGVTAKDFIRENHIDNDAGRIVRRDTVHCVEFRYLCKSGNYPDSAVLEAIQENGAFASDFMDAWAFIGTARNIGDSGIPNLDQIGNYHKMVFVGAFVCKFDYDGDISFCDDIHYLGGLNPEALGGLLI